MNETKYALITGATGGLGKAFVYALAKRGYALVLTGRSEDKLLALKEELNVPVIVCPADLSKADERTALFEEIEKQEESVIVELKIYNTNSNNNPLVSLYSDVKQGSDFTVTTDWGCNDVIVNVMQDEDNIDEATFTNNGGIWYYTISNVQSDVVININTNWWLSTSPFNTIYTQASTYTKWEQVCESELVDIIDLNDSNQWSYLWNDLPVLSDDQTISYQYYIVEDVPSGWNVSYEGNVLKSGNIVVKNIKDKESILLPETGGTPLVPMTILGITMMSLGIVYFKKKRRTHRKVGEFR